MNVAVIGGGYAGMAAAVTLAEKRVPVTVYEANKTLGGRARRIEHCEATLDNGLHILIGAYRETLHLMRLVGADPERLLERHPLAWRIHKRFSLEAGALPAPLHLLVALAGARGAPLGERLSAARFMMRMRRRGYDLKRDVTVTGLLAEHGQGPALTRLLWHPLCVSALNTRPDRASARVFLQVIRNGLGATRDGSDLLLPKTDLTALFPDPAAAYVEARGGEVRIGSRVTTIDAISEGFEVSGAGQRHIASHVICAVSPHHASALLARFSELAETVNIIDRLFYQPIYSVFLHYPQSVRLPAPMLGFDSPLLQWAFDREQLCGQTGTLGVVISAEGPHQALTHDELAYLVHQELQEQLGVLPDPSWHQVIAEKRATFACTPDLQRPPQTTAIRNFYLAGDYTQSDYPATLEAAVQSGIRCARQILSSG